MAEKSIGFVGTGNMAEAMIRGLLRGDVFKPKHIIASAPREERRRELADKYGIRATADNREAARQSIVVLSVKPQILSRVLEEVADAVSAESLVISIAAGVPVGAIQPRLRPGTRVVRAMPNTPALVDAGATAIARGEHADEADLEDAKRIFDAVGITVVLDESLLDAVTGLSGSGPAYVFLILEALSDAGVKSRTVSAHRAITGGTNTPRIGKTAHRDERASRAIEGYGHLARRNCDHRPAHPGTWRRTHDSDERRRGGNATLARTRRGAAQA
jgi:pyrroline-5-carboxylate reductase